MEGILAPDMRAGLNSQEKVAVGEIAVQLLNNQENGFGDSLKADIEPEFELDSLVVEHVQGLLSGVIDALVSDNFSSATDTSSAGPPLGLATATVIVPTVIMVYDGELEPNNSSSSSSSFSSTVVNSKSTFQNNSHLILTDNGEVTIFILNKDRKKEEKKHRESESIQSMSSSSSTNGDFQNITFSQVSSTPEGFKKNGSNFKMSESSSGFGGLQFQNSTNQFVMDGGNENIFPINRNVDEEQSLGNNTTGENISSNKTESLSDNFSTNSTVSTITTVTTTATTATTGSTRATMSTTSSVNSVPAITTTIAMITSSTTINNKTTPIVAITTTATTTSTTTTSTTTTTTTTSTTATEATKTTTTQSTTKKTTRRTTPAPPPTSTTPPPSLLQAVAQGVGAAMSTISGITAFNPLFLLLGRRRRSFDKVDKITNDTTFSEQETLHFPSPI